MTFNQSNSTCFQEDRPDHHYRTEIPNFVFEILNPVQLAVYAHLKRITGDSGKCWLSLSNLAVKMKMGLTKLKEILKELSQAGVFFSDSFIQVFSRKKEDGSYDTNLIKVTDIWRLNGDWHRNIKTKKLGGGVGRNTTGGGSPRDYKEEPSQEDPKEERKREEVLEPEVDSSLSSFSHEDEEKMQLLKEYNLCKSLRDSIMLHTLEEIRTGIKAMKQWKEKRESAGNPIGDQGTAILGAIRKKWKVNLTQDEIAKIQVEQKCKQLEKTEINTQIAKDLIEEFSEKAKCNITCIIKLSGNIAYIKVGKGIHPLHLADDTSIMILKRFISEQLENLEKS